MSMLRAAMTMINCAIINVPVLREDFAKNFANVLRNPAHFALWDATVLLSVSPVRVLATPMEENVTRICVVNANTKNIYIEKNSILMKITVEIEHLV